MTTVKNVLDLNIVRHLLIAALLLVVATVTLESTDPFRNAQLAAMSYYAIAAVGLTLLTGLNGQISLGHGALMAVGAYVTALMLGWEEPLAFPLVALTAIIATSVVGLIVGLAAARLSGPYLAGATLALAIALPGVAIYFKDTFGGEAGTTVRAPLPPAWFMDFISSVSGEFATGSKYVAYLGWASFAVTLFFLLNLTRSKVGRNWRAVRDNDVAAELAGINLGRTRVQAFVVSAACAGLAGSVMALVVRLAAPSAFTIVLSLSLLTAIVIGGLGSITGALIGAAILVFLPQVATGFAEDAGLTSTQAAQVSPLVYGIVLILVMLLAPSGIMGTIWTGWHRLRASRAAKTSAPEPTAKGDPTPTPAGAPTTTRPTTQEPASGRTNTEEKHDG